MAKLKIIESSSIPKVGKKWADAVDYIKDLDVKCYFTLSESFLDFVDLLKTSDKFKQQIVNKWRVSIPPYGFGFTKERLQKVATGKCFPSNDLSHIIDYEMNYSAYFDDKFIKDYINWRMFYRWGYLKSVRLNSTFADFLTSQKERLEKIYETGKISYYAKDEDLLTVLSTHRSVFVSRNKDDEYEQILRGVTVEEFRTVVTNKNYHHLIYSNKEAKNKNSLRWLLYVINTDVRSVFQQREKLYAMFRESLSTYGYGNISECEWMNDFFYFFTNMFAARFVRFDLIIDELVKLDTIISPIDFLSMLFVFTESKVFATGGDKTALSLLIAKGVNVGGYDFVRIVTDMVISRYSYIPSIREWNDFIDGDNITVAGTNGVEVIFSMLGVRKNPYYSLSTENEAFRYKYTDVYGDAKIYSEKLAKKISARKWSQ